MYGMTNMILFLVLVNFIASLMAVQLLRGDMSSDEVINFGHIYNAFLGMWQIFTSENWTSLLYASAIASQPVQQSIVVILFLTGWMLFANCTSPNPIVWAPSPHFPVHLQSSCYRCSSPSSTKISILRRRRKRGGKHPIIGQVSGRRKLKSPG